MVNHSSAFKPRIYCRLRPRKPHQIHIDSMESKQTVCPFFAR